MLHENEIPTLDENPNLIISIFFLNSPGSLESFLYVRVDVQVSPVFAKTTWLK